MILALSFRSLAALAAHRLASLVKRLRPQRISAEPQTHEEAMRLRIRRLFRSLSKPPHRLTVVENRRLDPLDPHHSTRALRLRGKSFAKPDAGPGDMLYVNWRNRPEDVDFILEYVGLSGREWILIDGYSTPWLPGKPRLMRLGTALETLVDLREASPALMKELGDETTAAHNRKEEEAQMRQYHEASSGDSESELISAEPVKYRHPGLQEVLSQVSGKISLKRLLTLQERIRPRPYSLSGLKYLSRRRYEAEITVSEVSKIYRDWNGLEHSGAARSAGFLLQLEKGDSVEAWPLADKHRFPPLIGRDSPLILICTGSGIAEAMSLLRSGICKGPVWLFYGVRSWTTKHLYGPELTKYEKDGVLNRITPASSRPGPEDGPRQYVQDALWEKREDVADWISRDAQFFLAGRLTMGVEVGRMLERILLDRSLASTSEEARALMKAWKASLRFQAAVSGF